MEPTCLRSVIGQAQAIFEDIRHWEPAKVPNRTHTFCYEDWASPVDSLPFGELWTWGQELWRHFGQWAPPKNVHPMPDLFLAPGHKLEQIAVSPGAAAARSRRTRCATFSHTRPWHFPPARPGRLRFRAPQKNSCGQWAQEIGPDLAKWGQPSASRQPCAPGGTKMCTRSMRARAEYEQADMGLRMLLRELQLVESPCLRSVMGRDRAIFE